MMKQLQLFKYATIGLVLLNIGIILFFFLTKPKPPRPMHEGPTNHKMDRRAIELLGLNKEQIMAFRDLAEGHSREMRAINEQQRKMLEPYFGSVVDSTREVATDAQLEEIVQLERRKIEITHQHFEDIKAILDTTQLANFERFVNESLKMILNKGGKNPPPGPKGF